MQEYEIAFKYDITWCINKIEPYNENMHFDTKNLPLYGLNKIKNDEIYCLLSSSIDEEEINQALKHKAFMKKAFFRVFYMPLKDDKLGDFIELKDLNFQGTFIEALNFIKDNWEKIINER